MDPYITIFTATYNRAYILPLLYGSLLNQSNMNFEWIVVDDGSTDDTKQLIEHYIQDNKIAIRYFYQSNQGKHVAINKGVSNARGILFTVVDSDDLLFDNAVEVLINKYALIQNKPDVAAIVSARRDKNDVNKRMTNAKIPLPDLVLFPSILRDKYGIKGEFSFTFKTQVLKEFPFPVFEGEKFMKESVVYRRIAKQYKNLYIQEPIDKCEYLPDGLSVRYWSLMKENPQGAALSFSELAKSSISFREKVTALNMYWDFEKDNHRSTIQQKLFNVPTLLMCLVLVFRKTKLIQLFIN